MGSSGPTSSNTVAKSALAAQLKTFPKFMELINKNILPAEQARLAASLATQPQFADLGRSINTKDRLASISDDNKVLNGGGRDFFNSIQALDKETNPEFYSNRAATSKSLTDLLGSYDMSGLSNGESAAVERAVNQGNTQSGNTSNPSALRTVNNAMQFGDAYHQKQNSLMAAIGTGTGLIQQSRSPIDATQTIFGRSSSSSNPSQFANIGANVSALGQNNYNKSYDYASDASMMKASTPSAAMQTLGALPDY